MNLISVIKLLCSLLAVFFVGYVPVYFLLEYKKRKKGIFNRGQDFSAFKYKAGFPDKNGISKQIFIFFVSTYLGFFIISNYLILLSLLNFKFGFLNASVFGLVFFAAFVIIQIIRFLKAKKVGTEGNGIRPADDKGERKEQTGKIGKASMVFQAIFAFLIFINFCVVTFFTFLFPIRFWDAISCWSLKGRAFFLDGNVTAFYTQHYYTFTHLTYPLYISLSQTWIYIWLGEINETLVKAIFPLFYLSLVFTVYYLLRKEVKRLYAIISVFILSTLPVIMDHGYLEYTNLIFSVILLLGVYYFYIYILKSSQSLSSQNLSSQSHTVQNQSSQSQTNQRQYTFTALTQSPDIDFQHVKAIQNIWDNLKNLIISAIFFAILVSVRSEGILFIAIFLLINTIYNISRLSGRLQKTKNFQAKYNKSVNSSKRRNTVLLVLISIILPAALIFLLLAPWTILQAKLNISGASTEWVPVIESLKNGLNSIAGSILPGSLKEIFNAGKAGSLIQSGSLKNLFNGTLAGGQSEILRLFDFKNASGAFLGEFLFSKFDSARAFLGSSYGISWIVLAVMAAFNLKKLFKAFNWIFFVFLSAGFIALFISLGFIADFAWSTERYMLHLFPLAYFWIMRSYLSNTISPRSLALEK